MKPSIFVCPILCMFFVFILQYCIHAQTLVSGVIREDTRWTSDRNPYIITDDIVVMPRARLEIGAGTQIFVGPQSVFNPSITQFDHSDSAMISIKVSGSLFCVGEPDKRICFVPQYGNKNGCVWYGIILTRCPDAYTELAYTDIAGAAYGIVVNNCTPIIRNMIFEYNNVAITCQNLGNARVYNCIIANNYMSGVCIQKANPTFFNCIIVYNRQNGVWSDGASSMTFKYNCVFGNADDNFVGCNPLLGVISKKSKGKDSVDFADNVCKDPVFAGSISDSLAAEKDVTLPTERSRIRDTTLAHVLYDTLTDSTTAIRRKAPYARYELSSYSPCRNAGNQAKEFNDRDGSRNDMGIYGGQEFMQKSSAH